MNIIEKLHAAEGKFSLVITGGGVSAIADLLAVAGASNTIYDANVPYDQKALNSFLGFEPVSACSEETARNLAMQACLRATRESATAVTGVGITAALATNRERRGADRIHIAIQSTSISWVATLQLDKRETRQAQETRCKNLIIHALAWNAGVINCIEPPPTRQQTQIPEPVWKKLFTGELSSTWESDKPPAALFPGAFNPPHEGHWAMKTAAEKMLNVPVVFEVSTQNVDKPPLDYLDMAERAVLLHEQPLVFTRAATFMEKSGLFPGTRFVVGVDTILRIADPKYYHQDEAVRDTAIKTLAARQHRFLVFGRQLGADFFSLDDITLPSELAALCDAVPETAFRQDTSSSALRAAIRKDE